VRAIFAAILCLIFGGGVFAAEPIQVKSLKISSSLATKRDVVYALPTGRTPKGGWPVVVFYQGSFFKSSFDWPEGSPFGGFYESETLKALVKARFAVVIPRAALGLAWMTNAGLPYDFSSDHQFLKNVFAAIADGSFGPINSHKKFAAGMSSGGYNTSRMAISFPGEFLGLAIHSASYATCLGPIHCRVPKTLPVDHPPTLFLHGEKDHTVPIATMYPYADKLRSMGIATEVFVDQDGGHQYFPETPKLVVDWFLRLLK
jgi:poly(3-hydroxyoctanoate) depolymerase